MRSDEPFQLAPGREAGELLLHRVDSGEVLCDVVIAASLTGGQPEADHDVAQRWMMAARFCFRWAVGAASRRYVIALATDRSSIAAVSSIAWLGSTRE